MIRAGIVGGGFMGATHAHAIRAAGGVVAGVASSSRASATRAADRLGAARAFDSLDALLGDETIDVVHVCSPNGDHVAHALAVIAAGRHVVCEKPLATSLRDAVRMRDAAADAGVVATVPFAYRFHPMVREARERVADRGRLFTILGTYLQDWLVLSTDDDWRAEPARGGPSRAFADIGSHLVDLLEFVSGERITRLQALTRTVHPERGGRPVSSEDAVALLVETTGGAIGSLLVSQVAAGRKNELALEISAEGGTVRFEQERPDSLWLGGRARTEVLARDPAVLGADAARLAVVPPGHPMGYQDAFNGFVRDTFAAIAGRAPAGLPTFDDGVRAVALTEAVLAAASSGDWVLPVVPTRAEEAA